MEVLHKFAQLKSDAPMVGRQLSVRQIITKPRKSWFLLARIIRSSWCVCSWESTGRFLVECVMGMWVKALPGQQAQGPRA